MPLPLPDPELVDPHVERRVHAERARQPGDRLARACAAALRRQPRLGAEHDVLVAR